jgi:hypothetical protein
MDDTARGLQPLRLNPFIFPSNTSLRFILLILIATCAGGRRWAEMTFAGFDLGPQLRRCLGDTTNYSDLFARTDAGLAGHDSNASQRSCKPLSFPAFSPD